MVVEPARGVLRGQCSTILRGTTYFSLLAARSQALVAQLSRTVVELAAESGFSSGRGSRADSCR